MNGKWIIHVLSAPAVLFFGNAAIAQQYAPATPPVVVVPCDPGVAPCDPCDVPCPPYLQSQPMVFDSAPVVMPVMPPPTVVYPAQGGVLPAPNAAPQPAVAVPTGPLGSIAPGGSVSPQFGLPAAPEAVGGLANPMSLPVVNDELAWDQITDVVDDYFTISSQQRARRNSDGWAEGRIETAPQGGATVLEPQRHDSVGTFNRWESTFQTIRRRAMVRVVPDAVGYSVEVVVEKELEDLPYPEHATARVAAFNYANSLPNRRAEPVSRTRSSPRWISLGRDAALEQRMLAEIHARLAGVTSASRPTMMP